MTQKQGWHPQSPWVDPRALIGSVLAHALLFIGLLQLSQSMIQELATRSTGNRPLRTEVESIPIQKLDSAGEAETKAEGDWVAADLLPTPDTKREAGDYLNEQSTIQNPGGSENAAETSGQGSGRGTKAVFASVKDEARSYAYVIDSSGSMREPGYLAWAKQELLQSLSRLPQNATFAVIFYNAEQHMITQGLELVTPENVERLRLNLDKIEADGSTRPRPAIEAALALGPEVLFLLTDGQDLSLTDVERLQDRISRSRIHTLELGGRPWNGQGSERALEKLARITGGTYHHIDVRSP